MRHELTSYDKQGLTQRAKKIAKALSLTLWAAGLDAAWADVPDIKRANNQVRVESVFTRVAYTETVNDAAGARPEVLDMERGGVPGKALALSVMTDSGIYLEAQYSRNRGYTNYTGAAMAGGPSGSLTGVSSASLVDYALRVGIGSAAGGSAMVTPYAEIGHHQWDRGVNFGETYTHSHLGGGVTGQYSPAGGLVLSGTALIGETFGAHISVAGPFGFSDNLGSSFIYRAGVLVDYAFLRNFHGHLGFDYTAFRYGKSNVNTVVLGGVNYYVWEPDSNTQYTTFRVGLGYAF